MDTTGLVIRERSVKDDRLLTILTKEYGVVSAFARGAKKPRGRLTSSTELFCYSRFVLFRNRDTLLVDRAETEHSFFALRGDLEKLSYAAYFAQLAQQLAPKEEPAPEQLRLLLNLLHFLAKGSRPPLLLKAVAELRLLSMEGYMPDLVGCSGCGCYEAKEMFFLPQSGQLLCGACRRQLTGPQEGMALPPEVLHAMRYIVYSDFEKLFSFSLGEGNLRWLGQVAEAYLLCQLGRGFDTLDFLHGLQAAPAGPGEGKGE